MEHQNKNPTKYGLGTSLVALGPFQTLLLFSFVCETENSYVA